MLRKTLLVLLIAVALTGCNKPTPLNNSTPKDVLAPFSVAIKNGDYKEAISYFEPPGETSYIKALCDESDDIIKINLVDIIYIKSLDNYNKANPTSAKACIASLKLTYKKDTSAKYPKYNGKRTTEGLVVVENLFLAKKNNSWALIKKQGR